MSKFVDLNLRLFIAKDEGRDFEDAIKRSAELGYTSVGIPFPIGATQKQIQDLEILCKENGLDLVKRGDLKPRNVRELVSSLRKLRRKREVISVCCNSKTIARQAARDHRADLISFPSADPRRRFFDAAEAELASKASASFEIDMAPLLTLRGFLRARLISCLRREAAIAKRFNVPIVMSSGTADKYLLRRPQDYASLAYLFGLDHQTAMKALSVVPSKIVERNREKLSPNYVVPGVYIVRRGENCQTV